MIAFSDSHGRLRSHLNQCFHRFCIKKARNLQLSRNSSATLDAISFFLGLQVFNPKRHLYVTDGFEPLQLWDFFDWQWLDLSLALIIPLSAGLAILALKSGLPFCISWVSHAYPHLNQSRPSHLEATRSKGHRY